MIKGVIFDLYGTLLDTATDLMASVNDVMKDYGRKAYTKVEVMQRVGNGFNNLLHKCLPDLDDEELTKAVDNFKSYYSKQYYKTTVPYEGISELVKDLQKRGYKLAVNSNKQDDYTKKLIALNFTEFPEDVVIGERPNINKKPDPAAVYEIMEKWGITNKDEIVYIGDSTSDIKTAANAGVKSLTVTWGFRFKEQLVEAGAVNFAETPDDILQFILNN